MVLEWKARLVQNPHRAVKTDSWEAIVVTPLRHNLDSRLTGLCGGQGVRDQQGRTLNKTDAKLFRENSKQMKLLAVTVGSAGYNSWRRVKFI